MRVDSREGVGDRVRVAHVDHGDRARAAKFPDCGRELLERARAPGDGENVVRLRETQRDRAPDAAGGAGDHCERTGGHIIGRAGVLALRATTSDVVGDCMH